MIINAVIVTYNRKYDLCRCLDRVLSQSVEIANVYVVDNASKDGTRELLVEQQFISPGSSGVHGKTVVHYVRLEKNTGGAGGFSKGMRLACPGSDYLWIMDDDGYPSSKCLEHLLATSGRVDYIMPVSMCAENDDKLTWLIRKKDGKFTRSYKELRNSFVDGMMNHAVPFNGLLIRCSLVEKVGYPKEEMFIWGDDFEYQYRCMEAGVEPVTDLDAIFYHPADKATNHRVFFGTMPLNYSESSLRFTCLIRNSTYNYWNYHSRYKILLKFCLYSWLFLVEKRFAIKEYVHYLKCVSDGIRGDFTRHLQFLE